MKSLAVTPYAEVSGVRCRVDPPAFPLDIFPSAVREFVLTVAASFPAPPDLVAAPVLTVAGAAIGTARSIRIKRGHDELPLLFLMVVGRPGSAKSPALHAVTRPAWLVQRDLHYSWRAEQQDAQDEDKPEPTHPAQRVGSDFTMEAIAEALSLDSRGILYHLDEGAAWVRAMDAYRGGRGADLQYWLAIWTSSSLNVKRKRKAPLFIERPFVTVLGGIQPDVLAVLNSGRQDGFLDRVLFAYPEPRVFEVSRSEVPEVTRQAYHAVIECLYGLQPQSNGNPIPLIPTPAACEAYYDWLEHDLYAELNSDDFPGHLEGPWIKLTSYALRFALILQLLHDPTSTSISEQHMLGALGLVAYFKVMAEKVHRNYHVDPTEARALQLLAWLKRQATSKVSVRDITRANPAGIKRTDDARELLEVLENLGRGKLTTRTYANGRTGDVFDVFS